MYQPIRCPNPRCPNPSALERVSEVVQQGTSTRTWIYGTTVTDVSKLAGLLSMPLRPKVGPGPFALGIAIFLGLPVFFGLIDFVLYPSFRRQIGVGGVIDAVVLLGLMAMVLLYRQATIRRRAAAFARWPQQQETWQQLYYCSGCQKVFNPAKPSKFVSAFRMEELLK